MGRKDKGYPFQRKQVLQLETSRRGLGKYIWNHLKFD